MLTEVLEAIKKNCLECSPNGCDSSNQCYLWKWSPWNKRSKRKSAKPTTKTIKQTKPWDYRKTTKGLTRLLTPQQDKWLDNYLENLKTMIPTTATIQASFKVYQSSDPTNARQRGYWLRRNLKQEIEKRKEQNDQSN